MPEELALAFASTGGVPAFRTRQVVASRECDRFIDGRSKIQGCAYLRASVPYSHRGHHDRWRVYVEGKASCSSATKALNVVMHLGGSTHVGIDDAHSYTDYQGWRCPFGAMGGQFCFLPKHRPYRARALALDCQASVTGCPAAIPRSYFG